MNLSLSAMELSFLCMKPQLLFTWAHYLYGMSLAHFATHEPSSRDRGNMAS